jgi:hypothetical protein
MADFVKGTEYVPLLFFGARVPSYVLGVEHVPQLFYGPRIAPPPPPAPTPPSVSFNPASGSSFAHDAGPVQFDVTDVDGLGKVTVFVLGTGRAEVVYIDTPPAAGGVPGYTVGMMAIGDGYRFTVERDGDWAEDFVLFVAALDADGAEVEASASYTLTTTPPPPDSVAPVVGGVTPAPGTPISATTPVSFEVTDDQGAFRRVLVGVELSGVVELVHDGDAFLGNYAGGGSTRNPIAGGFAYTILRDGGGWPSSPTVRVWAIDLRGNEA